MIIIIFLKVQAAAENFQISVSHLWSSQVIYPQTSDLNVIPGRESRIPRPNTTHQYCDLLTMLDGCSWLVSVSCWGPGKQASEKVSNVYVRKAVAFMFTALASLDTWCPKSMSYCQTVTGHHLRNRKICTDYSSGKAGIRAWTIRISSF